MNQTEKKDITIFGFLMILVGGGITITIGFDAYWHILSQSYSYQLNGAGVAGIIIAVLGFLLLIVGAVANVQPTSSYLYGPQPVFYQNIQPSQMQTTCPVCGQIFHAGFLSCPRCGTQLRMHCTNCGQQIDTRAAVCPYCNASTKS